MATVTWHGQSVRVPLCKVSCLLCYAHSIFERSVKVYARVVRVGAEGREGVSKVAKIYITIRPSKCVTADVEIVAEKSTEGGINATPRVSLMCDAVSLSQASWTS